MTFYLDLIMLMNFMFNGLILLLVNYLLRINIELKRILIATIFATLYIPLYIYIPHASVHSMISKIIYSSMIILIAFRFHHVRMFLKAFILFYFVAFTIGGGLLALHYVMEQNLGANFRTFLLFVPNIHGDEISLIILFSCFPLIAYSIKRIMNSQLMRDYQQTFFVDVVIHWNDVTQKAKGFIDTGNYLVDPLFQRPVMICNLHFMRKFFQASDWQKVEQAISEGNPALLPEFMQHDFTLIPYEGISGENAFLFAIKPTNVTFAYAGKQVYTKKVWLALRPGVFTEDHDYDCLINPKMLLQSPSEKQIA